MDYNRISAQRIKECREDLGLTQLQLAQKTGYVKSTIGNIEQFQTNPTLDLLCSICRVLEIHPSMLFISNIYYIKAFGSPARAILPTKLSYGDSGIFYYSDLGIQLSILNKADMRFLLSVMTMRRSSPFDGEQ